MEWFEYTLVGKDGIDLLQRISASDFRLSSPSESSIYRDGLILNPTGKITSYFKYQILSPESVSILIPTSAGDLAKVSFLESLDQYTFSEKYKLDFIKQRTILENESDRIRDCRPKIDFEFCTDGKTSPLDINFKEALADQKGCYPGQEVIEKIISIGQAAKKLCVLEISGVPALGEELLTLDFAAVGILTTIAADGKTGLGILRKTHAKNSQELKTKSGCTILVLS